MQDDKLVWSRPRDYEKTMIQTIYEVCDTNLIREKVIAGTVLSSEASCFTVLRAMSGSENLFEAVEESNG